MDINKPSNDEAIASDSSDSSSSLSSSSSDDSSSSSVSSENLLADVANERHSAASCASIHKTISQGAPGAVDGDLSANSDSENGDSTYATQVEQPPKKTRKTPVRNVERFPEKLNRLLREVEVIGRTDVISFIDDNTFKIHKKDIFFKEIAPHYFVSTKLSNFKLVLREHGFEWISSGPNRGAYRHALFSKIDPSKCKQIIRLVSHKKQTTDKTFDNKPPAQADASKRVYQHYFDREPETNSGDVEPPGTRRQKRTYYDSDNSYEPLSEEKPVETIDWDDHANQTWGRKQLIKGLGDFERSALLCLATTHATEEDADELRESPCRQSPQFQDPKHENPLVPLDSSPLPLSHLNYFISRSSKVPGFAEKLYRSFGDSALVAIGMILEEMLTASLLPLAGLHVLRCRELENKHSSGEDAETHVPSLEENRLLLNPINGQAIESRCTVLKGAETPFEEWTLPPDEACFKLLEQGFMPRNGVPLVQEPTREMPASVVNGAKLDRQETSIRNWMETQEVDPNFVAENSEVFRLFISGDLPPVQKKRRK